MYSPPRRIAFQTLSLHTHTRIHTHINTNIHKAWATGVHIYKQSTFQAWQQIYLSTTTMTTTGERKRQSFLKNKLCEICQIKSSNKLSTSPHFENFEEANCRSILCKPKTFFGIIMLTATLRRRCKFTKSSIFSCRDDKFQ